MGHRKHYLRYLTDHHHSPKLSVGWGRVCAPGRFQVGWRAQGVWGLGHGHDQPPRRPVSSLRPSYSLLVTPLLALTQTPVARRTSLFSPMCLADAFRSIAGAGREERGNVLPADSDFSLFSLLFSSYHQTTGCDLYPQGEIHSDDCSPHLHAPPCRGWPPANPGGRLPRPVLSLRPPCQPNLPNGK